MPASAAASARGPAAARRQATDRAADGEDDGRRLERRDRPREGRQAGQRRPQQDGADAEQRCRLRRRHRVRSFAIPIMPRCAPRASRPNARPMPHAITSTLKIALAQLNPVVGDLAGNAAKLRKARAEAAALGADLVVYPELFITGYPPEDLVRKPAFAAAARAAVEALAAETGDGGPGVIVGTIWAEDGKLYNSVALLDGGRIEAVRHKVDLPNYGVFDEKRVFDVRARCRDRSASAACASACRSARTSGRTRCASACRRRARRCSISPNGSPFDWPKPDQRMNVAVARVTETGLPLLYLNQVGGQDELVFDGASFVLNADAGLAAQLPAWEEARPRRRDAAHGDRLALRAGRARGARGARCGRLPRLRAGSARLRRQERLPRRRAWGCPAASTSALVAAMAVDALGPARVHCVMLPYRYTSNESLSDAADCAKALGVRYDIVPISPAVEGFLSHAQVDVRRPRARRHRGEHAEPRARHGADGDLQQVRRHGADHRQQERDVGRLRHALRRHERRLQSDQGPLQDGGLPARRAGATRMCPRAARGRAAW